MYSGSESGDSQKLTAQWPLNPAAYQNMAADQVDWAALAQQWIIMKEAGPPPVPGEPDAHKPIDIVGGEAPMDVENAIDDAPSWDSGSEAPPAPGAEAWTNWNSGSWGWGNNWSNPVAPPAPPISKKPPPLLPTPTYPAAADDNAVSFSGYTTGPHQKSTYWNSGSVVQKEIKPHNKRYSKVNVPIKAPVHIPPPLLQTPVAPPVEMMTETPTLDAAKRKQLPAWIREGLEKMEKDKLKQMQKDKEKLVMDEYKEKAIQSEKERLEVLKNTMKEEQQLKKSRFDSDDESDKEVPVKKKNKSPEPPVELTPDEKMIKVRRTMTEILLKTTSKFIESICKEEHQRYLKKRRASAQLGSAPSGANLRAKLGLGAYGDGSSSSSDSEPDEKDRNQSDSDNQLKENIKRKMADFSRIEREIEDRLANADTSHKEESRSRSSSPESRGNDSQVDEPAQEIKHHRLENENGSTLDFRNRSRSSSEDSNYKGSKNPRRNSTSSNDSPKKSNRRESERDRLDSDNGKEEFDKIDGHKRRNDNHHDQSERTESERRRSSRERSESRTPDRKYKRQSSRYSETPERKRRSRSRSLRRDSTESKRKSRRSDESVRSSRRSQRSHKSRSRSSSYYRKSKKSSRRSRSRSHSRDSRRTSKRSKHRSRSHSQSRSRRHRRSGSSTKSRRHSRSSSTSSDDYSSSRGKRSHRR